MQLAYTHVCVCVRMCCAGVWVCCCSSCCHFPGISPFFCSLFRCLLFGAA